MGLFRRRRKTLGLDIGSAYVKLVEVHHGGDTPELHRVAVEPVPAGALADGEVTRPERVAEVVQEMMETRPGRSAEVVTALGGHDVFMKTLTLACPPGVTPSEMAGKEAARHVPFDLREILLDSHVLRATDGDGPVEVLLVAAKRERVEARVDLLGAADIGVALMDVDALALHNALVHNHPEAKEGMVALVNVGHDVTNINIVDDGIPVLLKDLPVGSGWLVQWLRREAGLAPAQAEGALRGRQHSADLADALDEAAARVVTGIERASAFRRARRPGRSIGRVYLSGGGACIPGLADHVARMLKIETRLANPCQRVIVRPGVADHWVLDKAAPMLCLSVGLALRAA